MLSGTPWFFHRTRLTHEQTPHAVTTDPLEPAPHLALAKSFSLSPSSLLLALSSPVHFRRLSCRSRSFLTVASSCQAKRHFQNGWTSALTIRLCTCAVIWYLEQHACVVGGHSHVPGSLFKAMAGYTRHTLWSVANPQQPLAVVAALVRDLKPQPMSSDKGPRPGTLRLHCWAGLMLTLSAASCAVSWMTWTSLSRSFPNKTKRSH